LPLQLTRLVREDQVIDRIHKVLVLGEDSNHCDEYCEVTKAIVRNGSEAEYIGVSDFFASRRTLDVSEYDLVVMLECEREKVLDGFCGAMVMLFCARAGIPLLVIREKDELDVNAEELYGNADDLCMHVFTQAYEHWDVWVRQIVVKVHNVLGIRTEYVPEEEEREERKIPIRIAPVTA